VNSGDSAELGVTLLMGSGAVAVHVLGAKTPVARLPERTLLLDVIGTRLIALEAIGELGLASLTPLA